MFIEPEQIRAARAMLNWSQTDLAEAAGVSKDTVKNYESGNNQPNISTLTKLSNALESNGLDIFTGGVQWRKKEVLIFKGQNGFHKFYDYIYEEVQKTQQTELYVCNVDERLFMQWGSSIIEKHTERMKELNATYKILIRHGDNYFVASEYAKYKWLPDQFFSTIPYYVFGDRVALILFQDEPVIYTLPEREIMLAYKQQFDALWQLSEKPLL